MQHLPPPSTRNSCTRALCVLSCAAQTPALCAHYVQVKVARPGSSPEDDARMVVAVRAAVGARVLLRCDANRGWTLDQALRFGALLSDAGCRLEYLEEPVRDVLQLAEFCHRSGMRVALDETVDAAARGDESAASLLTELGPDQVTTEVEFSKDDAGLAGFHARAQPSSNSHTPEPPLYSEIESVADAGVQCGCFARGGVGAWLSLLDNSRQGGQVAFCL